MKKHFFKAAYIALIAVFATFLSAGLISLNGEKAVADGGITKSYEDTTVTAFGDVAGMEKGRLMFALSVNDYTEASKNVNATQVESLNWTSKIKITIGGEEKTLADCYLSKEVYLNFWTRPNIISVDFNGDYTKIAKIVVEKGCEFPSSETAEASDNLKVYRTTEEAVFYNVGKAMFYKETAYTVATATETKVNTFGDPDSATDENAIKRLFFCLSVHDYSVATQQVKKEQSEKLNWNTKIKITVNGEEKILAAYAPIAETYLRIFDRAGAPVALTITSLSDYRTIEKIVIEKGCHFPSYATKDSENNFAVFVTTEDAVFVNDGTGKFINLNDAKSAAKKEIEGYNPKNLFEAAEKERVAIVVQAKADIENGDTYEGISTVVSAAKAAIDKLETAPDVGLIGGASIRTSVPYGIRWTAKIRTADWEKLATLYGEKNVKAGVLVLPYDSLTDGVEFTVEALGAAKIPYQQIETDIFNETASNDAGDGYSGFYASLVNIKAGNLNRKFIARAYISVTSGDATTCYYGDYSAENQARSIYEVSKKVIVSNTESEATKQFAMTGVLDKVVEVTVSGGAATLVQTDGYTSPYSVSVSGGTLIITAAEASGADVNDIGVVCVNGKNYKPTVSNGVVTVSIN